MSTHALLAPSAAHRWTECTASVMFIKDHEAELPPSGGSYADEGTKAHELAKQCLLTGSMDMTGDDMSKHVNAYINFVTSKKREGATFVVEQEVPLFYDVEMKGTVDAAILSPDLIEVCDLKYGQGVSVDAYENKQLAIYTMSLVMAYSLKQPFNGNATVRMHIFQPRDRNNPEAVRSWEMDLGQLIMYCRDNIEVAVTAIKKGTVQFKADPTTQCRFCPAKGICKAFATYGLEALPPEVTILAPEPSLPDPHILTREQRIKVLRARRALEDWLDAVQVQEVSDLLAGAPPAGFKMVEGKTNRQWADENAAFQLLHRFFPAKDLRPPSRLLSPAQIEKLLTGKTMSKRFYTRLNSLITKPEGKPSLVPDTDKRPALQFNPTKTFENLDNAEII